MGGLGQNGYGVSPRVLSVADGAEAATASQIICCMPRVSALPPSPLQGITPHETTVRLPLPLRVHAGRGRPPLPSLPSTLFATFDDIMICTSSVRQVVAPDIWPNLS